MRRAHEKIRKKYHKDTKHMFEKPNDRIGAWSAAGENNEDGEDWPAKTGRRRRPQVHHLRLYQSRVRKLLSAEDCSGSILRRSLSLLYL